MTHLEKPISNAYMEIENLRKQIKLLKKVESLEAKGKIRITHNSPKTLHFKTKGDYMRFLSYIHIHGLSTGTKHPVTIAGKPHRVIHST